MSQINQGLWAFLVVASGFSLIWLIHAANRKFRLRFDPIKKDRQKIAEQTGLKMAPMQMDIFALQGTYNDRFARLFTTYSRMGGKHNRYEVWFSNPSKIDLAFHFNTITPLLREKEPTLLQNATEKVFREQFKISGKSKNIVSDFMKREELIRELLQIAWQTGTIKIELRHDRVICQELSPVILDVRTVKRIFGILVELADWVESMLSRDP